MEQLADKQLHVQVWPVPCYSVTNQADKRPGDNWLEKKHNGIYLTQLYTYLYLDMKFHTAVISTK